MNKKQIDKKIDALSNSERVTKQTLAELSRDLLAYVMQTQDIATVNRLFTVLTPMNCKSAVIFFRHFLPWKMPENDTVFGEKKKGKKLLANAQEAIDNFLVQDDNNIWTWLSDQGVEPKPRPKNYAQKITNVISKALTDNQEGISELDILSAIVNGGLSVDHIIDQIDKVQIKQKEQIEPAH